MIKREGRTKMRKNQVGEALAFTFFMFYLTWAFLPSVFSRISAQVAIVFLVLSGLGVILDRSMPRKAFVLAVVKYAFSGILSFFIWWIGRRQYHELTIYMANSILLWFPLPFSLYLVRKRDSKFLSFVKAIMLMSIAITCITTIVGTQQYPLAPRLLAGATSAQLMEYYFGQNIGGYSFIYAITLLFPLFMYEIVYAKNLVRKIAFTLLSFLVVFTVVFSQYLIAIYMILVSMLALMIYWLLAIFKRKSINKPSNYHKLLVSVMMSGVIFLATFSSINQGLAIVFERANLNMMADRASSVGGKTSTETPSETTALPQESVAESPTDQTHLLQAQSTAITAATDTVETTVAQPIPDLSQQLQETRSQVAQETGTDDPINPLLARLNVYKVLIDTFPNNPLTGNLFGKYIVLSGHSEILDALLGGGIVGAVLVLALIFIMFKGNFRSTINSSLKPYVLLMALMVLGLGMVNTLTYSREFTLVCLVYPFLINPKGEELSDAR